MHKEKSHSAGMPVRMVYGSVCSGIEAASVAWEPLGMSPAWFSEIEKFPSAVLQYHWPYVQNLGDMTRIPAMIAENQAGAPDILVGGTPCQAFSIAGLRNGLDDERGKLTLSFVELANVIDSVRAANNEQPSIIVWENVPGVLSSRDNAFGCFLAWLAGEDEPLQQTGKRWTNAGYVSGPQRAVAWRVLDAQYFGVTQRRRRVFVVASARKGFCPAKVLFEFEGGKWATEPNKEGEKRRPGETDFGTLYRFRRTDSYVSDGVSSTLSARDYKGARDLVVMQSGAVRTLTPIEYERLQGFPDNHTLIDGSTDSVRYKAIGNSMAVPVIRWLGERILQEVA